MKTYNRICIKNLKINKDLTLKRGTEYLTTSVDDNNCVTVFTLLWIWGVPVEIFAGERIFTKS